MSDVSFWDQRYGEPGFAYGEEPADFLVEVADRLPPGRALCLAEGQGRNAVFLAARGLDVVALDHSPVGLAGAERLAAARGVRIRTLVADLATYEIEPDDWDIIISIWFHPPSALRRRVHRGAVAGLRPGGMFVLQAYGPGQLRHDTGGPKVPDQLPSLAALREELSGLELMVAEEREVVVREGPWHQGVSSVVRALGRKGDLGPRSEHAGPAATVRGWKGGA